MSVAFPCKPLLSCWYQKSCGGGLHLTPDVLEMLQNKPLKVDAIYMDPPPFFSPRFPCFPHLQI